MNKSAEIYLAKKRLEKWKWHNAIMGLTFGGLIIAGLIRIFYLLIKMVGG